MKAEVNLATRMKILDLLDLCSSEAKVWEDQERGVFIVTLKPGADVDPITLQGRNHRGVPIEVT